MMYLDNKPFFGILNEQQKVGERLDKIIAETEDNLFMSESERTKRYFENLHKKHNDNNGEIVFGNVRPTIEPLIYNVDSEEDGVRVSYISGYEIDYYATEDKPEGNIKFPKTLLGKTYNETAANVRKMLYTTEYYV